MITCQVCLPYYYVYKCPYIIVIIGFHDCVFDIFAPHLQYFSYLYFCQDGFEQLCSCICRPYGCQDFEVGNVEEEIRKYPPSDQKRLKNNTRMMKMKEWEWGEE